jgi:hypothetical protein
MRVITQYMFIITVYFKDIASEQLSGVHTVHPHGLQQV